MFSKKIYSDNEIESQRNVVRVLETAVSLAKKPMPGGIRDEGGIGFTAPTGDGVSEQDRKADANTLNRLRDAQAKLEAMELSKSK